MFSSVREYRTAAWCSAPFVAVSLIAPLLASPAAAGGLPTGGQVVAGQASISTAPGQMSITQAGGHAIINWQDFSIAAGNGVKFNNGGGATLNRVIGGSLSQIDGVLKATGSVYLINPQGVVIGSGGKVITGGSFVASTRDMDNDAFMRGDALHVSGASNGNVVNQGKIVSRYGDTILIGKSVSNSGTIKAPHGTAGLAAGDDVVLRPMDGDARISVSAGKGDVTNTGTISAAQAELTAAGGNVYAVAGNQGGISATGVKTVGGRIWLSGGGTTEISGAVTATNTDGSGGTIIATAPNVTVDANANISASGTTGGTVLLGGDEAGGSDAARKHVSSPVATAKVTTVAQGAKLSADGSAGAGGAVVIWSDDHTSYDGFIGARGTGQGNGGSAEVSSHGVLDFNGFVDLTSVHGVTGNLLLDPYAVTIVAGTGGTISGGKFTATATSNLGATTLTNALAGANITVSTGSGSGTGSITLNSGVNLAWTSSSILTLDASAKATAPITLGGAITAANGGLVLKAGSSATITDTAAISVGNFTLASGNWSQNTASLPAFSAASFTLSGGSFLRVAGGNGSSTPYQITDIYGLQGMLGYSSSNFSLANDLDASGTAGWNGGAGFVPLTLNNGFTFDGQNHTITGLTINQPSGYNVGLFGYNYGTIQNLKLAGGAITGFGGTVGAVAGQNGSQEADYDSGCQCYVIVSIPAYILNVTSSATVNGAGYSVGGLVGTNYGSITGSAVTGAVNGADGSDGQNYGEQVGGLAGSNSGTIDASSASGNVTGFDTVGGLVGVNASAGSITNSHAGGTITVPAQSYGSNAGGLAGQNDGLIDTAYATGNVNGINDPSEGSTYLGGLVGVNRGAIKNANASGSVTGQSYIGGLVGANGGPDHYISTTYGGTIENSYATGGVTGISYVGGLAGANGAVTYYDSNGNWTGVATPTAFSSITGAYAAGTVTGNQSVGGLAGINQAGTITGSHAGGMIVGVASTDPWSGYTFNASDVGGLVGENDDTIIASYANATIAAGAGSSYIGGLVGNNTGSISGSYAQGSVSGEYWVGGLAGQNTGTIDLSHADAAVYGGDGPVGGLVGKNGDQYAVCGDPNCTSYSLASVPGVITNSYATGNVTATGGIIGGLVGDNYDTITASYASGAVSGVYYVGGLVGANENTGAISRAYASGAVTGSSYSVGGAIGINYGAITDAYATGGVTGTSAGDCCLGGFVGDNEGSITNVYASGAVSGPNYYDAGALVGWNGGFSHIGYITTSYWNTDVANGLPGVGADTTASHQAQHAKGLTSAQMQVSSNFQGFDFTNTWSPASNGYAPALYGVSYVVRVDTAGSYQYGDPIQSTFYGLQNGDLPSIVTGLVTITDAPGVPQVGQVYQGSASGAMATSSSGVAYRFIYNNGPVTITQRQITVQAAGASKTYGDVDPAFTYQITNGSLLTGDSFTGALARAGGENVGSYAITLGSLGINSNYAINFLGASFTINPATLTYTANTATRTYGGSDPAFSGTITGFIAGESQATATTGTLTFTTTAVAASTPGSYAINGSGLTANNGNYVFVQAAGNAGAYTITKAPLTFTANPASRAYGSGNGTLSGTVTGYVLNQTQSTVLSGNASWSSSAGTTTDVGSYAINGTATFKSGYGNDYVIVQAASNTTALTVTPKTLTWSVAATPNSATYGTLGSLGAVTLTGIVSGDSGKVVATAGLFDALGNALTYSATTNAGSYTEGAAILSGVKALDYVLAAPGTTGTTSRTYTINPMALTVTADTGQHKIYGDVDPSFTYQITTGHLVGGDALTGALSRATGEDVGSYAITRGSLAASANYTLTYAGADFTINPMALTVTADAGQSKTYGDADPASYTYQITGGHLVGGDALTGALSRATGEDAGSYAIAQGTLAATSNYALTYTGANFTISPMALTVTADVGLSKTYGDADPASYTYQITGGHLVGGNALTGALSRATGEDAGSYAITLGTLAATSNYALTYAGASFTISPMALTVTADTGQFKTYGDADPSFAYQITSGHLVGGDALIGALARDPGEDAGSYAITRGTLAATSNYTLTYAGANFTISPMALTVTADVGQSKTYGDADPSFTYQITSGHLVGGDTLTGALARDAGENAGSYAITQGSLSASADYVLAYTGDTFVINPRALTITAGSTGKVYGDTADLTAAGFTADGLMNGDTISSVIFASTGANAGAAVGSYAITAASAAGTGLANYMIAYRVGALTVTPRPLTVTVANASAVYGAALPSFTVTATGLVNGDTLSGAPVGANTGHVGSYPITQGTLTASSNYTLTFQRGTLTITPAALVITANDITAPSVTSAQPTARYSGLVNGDGSAVVTGLQFGLFPVSGVSYTVVPFGATASDYTIGYVSGVLTITAEQPSQIALAIPPQTGTASGNLTIGGQTFTFSAAATSAISGGSDMGSDGVLLFQVGLPGQLSGFTNLVLFDYSNASGDGDRLSTQ